MSSPWRSNCCNPLNKPRHSAAKKCLRPVTKKMREQFGLELGLKICDNCRKALYKPMPPVEESSEESSYVHMPKLAIFSSMFFAIFGNTILCQLLPYLAILDIPILPFLATSRVCNAGSVPMNVKIGNI